MSTSKGLVDLMKVASNPFEEIWASEGFRDKRSVMFVSEEKFGGVIFGLEATESTGEW